MQTRRSGRIAKQQPAAPVAVPPETPQAGNKRNDEGAIKPRQAPQLPLDEEEVAGTLATPSTSKKVPGKFFPPCLSSMTDNASDKAVQSDCPKFLQLQEREAEVAVGLQQVHPGSGPGIRGRGSPRMFSRIVKSLSGSRTWKPRLGTFLPTSTTYPWSCKTSFQPQPRSDMINAMLRLWRGLRYCSRATPFR
ncbi:hypothetical protein FPSE5266_08264 [Fusarium pseudograminearum]|nr:hypothetical protein FPSE5266_08264 [Fusarium pseudograminearum]